MKTATRILIADDHAVVRMGLASLLGTQDGLEVIGDAEDGEATVAKALELKPDVIIMDLMMPKKDGATATAEIHAVLPNTKILILTTFGTSDGIANALNAGATGALMKNAPNSQLVEAIRTIANGGRAVSEEVERLMEEDPPAKALTPRQMEILEGMTRGLTNQDIAKELGIREDRVKDHVNAIFSRLNAANRTEAVAIAMRKYLLKQWTQGLASLVRGLTNDDIAKQFSIQRSSVKDHLTAFFAKLSAANRSEAISIALRKQLIKNWSPYG